MSADEAEIVAPGGSFGWRAIILAVLALAGAAVLVALILTLRGANRERDRALQLQGRSYDVMILARTVAGTIARAEASLGRYVISTDRQLGQLYADEWQAAGSQLDRLARITAADAEQQRRISRLRDAYETRGEELSLTALSTRYKKNNQALALYHRARQAPALAAIHRELDLITAYERMLLNERTARAMATVRDASRIAGILAGFGILLVLGAITLGWIIVRTMRERAEAETEAAAASQRADELSAAVAAATDELRVQEARLRQVQKMEAVGQLTGGIAHDFNNMLAVVTGGLELAARSLTQNPAAARRHIESATEGANRAAALTRRLLAFSREESLKPESIEVAQLVAGMRDLLDRTLGDGITVLFRDEARGWRVRADRVQLENALLNLAVNARDAMDGRGELTIVSGAVALAGAVVGDCVAGDYVTVAVHDTGCGMTAEVAERVFEPFFTTKEVGKGTGLGLSQIFALVQQLGGAVGIASAPGAGTTVTLHLPRDKTEERETTHLSLSVLGAAPPPSLDILVVEDDPRVLAATMGALAELGHRPVACDDPLRAPAMLEAAGGVDLLMSDVLMPRQTGPEMVAGLEDRWPNMAVMFVTGFAGDVATHQLHGRPVLRKPYTLAALESTLAEAMAQRDAQPEPIAAE
ncbi:ATP-binding protein [Sphingomonas sp.]|uniref:ATP-binding protein n=1 Tax=Sphingomonas sp. TaxID=28214 RepID=UPI002D7EB6E6|nr:ATP-binding protein [Sphingomonas sp.]HEU0045212.1 ATP-binding protein [Sphingomonas sp.]